MEPIKNNTDVFTHTVDVNESVRENTIHYYETQVHLQTCVDEIFMLHYCGLFGVSYHPLLF